MAETLLWILALALMAAGLAGTVLPALPGIPLMLLGMVVAAWIHDFTRIGTPALIVLALLAALSFVIDFAAASLGAKRVGASRQAIAGAALGAVLGMFFGLPGLILGPFVGAVAGELMASRGAGSAIKAGAAAWAGFAIGTVAKVAVAFTMLGVFAAAWFID
jgi:uncharacterized protein YqgC (DUF456 family)